MKTMKIKAIAFRDKSPDDGIRPDCIIYCAKAAVSPQLFGLSLKKWNKAISKVIGKFQSEIPDDLFILIYVDYDKSMFETTHAIGTPGEHTVFHEEPFKKSLKNFLEFKRVSGNY